MHTGVGFKTECTSTDGATPTIANARGRVACRYVDYGAFALLKSIPPAPTTYCSCCT